MDPQVQYPQMGGLVGKTGWPEKIVRLISKGLNGLAGLGLTGMLSLVVADIIGIKLFKHPVPGGIEVVAFLGVIVTGFAIAWTQVIRGHIQVDFLIMKLPHRWQGILEALVTILGLGLFIMMAWRGYDYGRALQTSGEASMTQRIPVSPFVYALAFCYLATALVLAVDAARAIRRAVRR